MHDDRTCDGVRLVGLPGVVLVGASGGVLSGGQHRRLGVARRHQHALGGRLSGVVVAGLQAALVVVAVEAGTCLAQRLGRRAQLVLRLAPLRPILPQRIVSLLPARTVW